MNKQFASFLCCFMLLVNNVLAQEIVADVFFKYPILAPPIAYKNFVKNNSKPSIGFVKNNHKSLYSDTVLYKPGYVRASPFSNKMVLGVGYDMFTQGLNENYTSSRAYRAAAELYYKRIGLKLHSHIGASKTKQDLTYSLGIWEKGSSKTVYLGAASIGVLFFKNQRMQLTQFAGIGSMSISPSSGEEMSPPEHSEVSLSFTKTFLLAINVDVRLGKIRTVENKSTDNYRFLRLIYNYCDPAFESKYKEMSGIMHGFALGLGFYFGDPKVDNGA